MKYVTIAVMMVITAFAAPGEEAEPTPETPAAMELIVQAGVQAILSQMLEVDVEVDSVTVDQETKLVELHGLRVKNPQGFEAGNAFTADTVRLQADIKSLLSRTPKVDLVEMQGASVSAISNLRQGSNLLTLLKNARRTGQAGALQRLRPPKRWEIHRAVLGETQVSIVNDLIKREERETTVGPKEFSFGTDGNPAPGDEIVSQFLDWLVEEVGLFQDQPEVGKGLTKWLPKVM
jgi:hypothetical protein